MIAIVFWAVLVIVLSALASLRQWVPMAFGLIVFICIDEIIVHEKRRRRREPR